VMFVITICRVVMFVITICRVVHFCVFLYYLYVCVVLQNW